MTHEEILNRFKHEFPLVKIDDYRPICHELFTDDKQGITIWLDNGDIIEYYPNTTIEALSDRPHSEWIKTVDGNGWDDWYVFKCPFCGATIKDKQCRSWEYNFCPNCGADMIPYKGGE